jgi:hypothetical protein
MQNQQQPIEYIIKHRIGKMTYMFLDQTPRFRKTLDLLYTSQMLINNLKGKILISTFVRKREYSYIIAPAAKALEGALLAMAFFKEMISDEDLDKGISIGKIYDNINGKPAKAKAYVLKPKDTRIVDSIYGDWSRFRNKTLHYDEDYFVNTINEAEEIVKDINRTIRTAYQIFVGSPDKTYDELKRELEE